MQIKKFCGNIPDAHTITVASRLQLKHHETKNLRLPAEILFPNQKPMRSNSFCVSPSSLNETIPYRHALTKFFVKQNLPLSSQSPYKETDVAGMRHAGSSQQNLINHTETDVFCMYHYNVQVFQVSPIYLHLLQYKV